MIRILPQWFPACRKRRLNGRAEVEGADEKSGIYPVTLTLQSETMPLKALNYRGITLAPKVSQIGIHVSTPLMDVDNRSLVV